MNELPKELLFLIFENVDDRDFINVMLTSTEMNKLDKTCKILHNQYKLSIIMDKQYIFTNILHDRLEWNFNAIPKNLIKIEFVDGFNQNIGELFTLENLQSIKIGMFYTNDELLENDLDRINKRELVQTFICNKIFATDMKSDIDRLHNIHAHKNFPGWFCEISCYKIFKKVYNQTIMNQIVQNPQQSQRFMRKYEHCNNHINQVNKYEVEYYLNNINNLTSLHWEFYGFLIDLMIANIRKLTFLTYAKYNCDTFDDFMCLIWGKEGWTESKRIAKEKKQLRNNERKERKRKEKHPSGKIIIMSHSNNDTVSDFESID